MSKKSTGKIGVLLVNLGTPDTPNTPDVRKYLREFLMDKRVIDMPVVQRYALINGIIAPFRAPKSAKVYKELWTERGSPLLFHGHDLQQKLQEALGSDYHVAFGMRYQSPSIQSALEELREQSVDRIIVLPLFPQYASASTGSVQDKVMEIVKDWWVIPNISFISSFCDDEGFINAFATLGKQHMAQDDYDHVVFSYHGVPERHILKGSDKGYCKLGSCCNTYHKRNKYCYRASCFVTSRLLAAELGLREDQYSVAFQSRLGKDPWLTPYTDFILKDLPAKGIKKVLAYSPAFVADCLETTIEVGEEFREMFLEAGGEKWQLVESLNSHPLWVEAVKEMVLKN
ncbi:ferrochelatase [Pontibacter beigongshangensis]|uniref:ferrochelatase n=1 Tax=Pontibacter beigongshangensis TaxID=2574733 RepID=UPI00164FD0E7|nr:ferrochelatase [Pontibacter beigongshangensis]